MDYVPTPTPLPLQLYRLAEDQIQPGLYKLRVTDECLRSRAQFTLGFARAVSGGLDEARGAIGQAPSGDSAGGTTGATGTAGATGSSVNGDLLGNIAEKTDAKAYTTRTAGELTQVYDTLGSRLSYELAIDSRAGPFVIAAVVMTLAAAVVTLSNPRDPYAQKSSKRPRGR
jgi:hypothetical protein